jgi:hypothetical protein
MIEKPTAGLESSHRCLLPTPCLRLTARQLPTIAFSDLEFAMFHAVMRDIVVIVPCSLFQEEAGISYVGFSVVGSSLRCGVSVSCRHIVTRRLSKRILLGLRSLGVQLLSELALALCCPGSFLADCYQMLAGRGDGLRYVPPPLSPPPIPDSGGLPLQRPVSARVL